MSLTRKPSMTTSPQKNLPRTSLFFSVQILSLGAVDKSYNSMCELNKATHYPMKQIAMVYILWKSPSVKLQRRCRFSQNETIAFCLIAAAVVAGCVLTRAEEKRLEPDALFIELLKRKIRKPGFKYKLFIHY